MSELRKIERRCGTYDVELHGLDGGSIDNLQFFSLGKAEVCKVLCEALDSPGSLHAHGLMIGYGVLVVLSGWSAKYS